MAALQQGKARGFKANRAAALHNSTDFERWTMAEQPYAVEQPHDRRAVAVTPPFCKCNASLCRSPLCHGILNTATPGLRN